MKRDRKIFAKLIYLLLVAFLLFLILFVIRIVFSRQVDDVSPLIECDHRLIEKSESLAVIPVYENISISENEKWCEYIKSLNKTLVMHGVYHKYREFWIKVDEEEFDYGIGEFEKCFGYKPRIFEAPQLSLSRENVGMIESKGMKIRGYWFNVFHKVYHCNDTGRYSNNFIDRF